MYGFRIIAGSNYNKDIPQPVELRHFCRDDITEHMYYDDGEVKIMSQKYAEYPVSFYETPDGIILFEGMVYNETEVGFVKKVKTVLQNHGNEQNIIRLIRNLTNETDGDFAIFLYQKINKRFFVFGDYWARLPIYYHKSNNVFVVSRSLKFIYSYMDDITINKFALVDYLRFGYPLGNRLIIQDIFRIKPTEIIYGRIINGQPARIIHEEDDGFNFDRKGKPASFKKSINEVYEILQEATENRVNTIKLKGLNLLCDISGGFDSRTNFGLLNKIAVNIKYLTYVHTNNEVHSVMNLFKLYKSILDNLEILKSPESFEKDTNIQEIIFDTDGLVDFKTTIGSLYMSSIVQRSHIGVRIMGFGGEFIRHPHFIFHKSLINTIKLGYYANVEACIDQICSRSNVDLSDYIKHLDYYFKTYPEQTKEGLLKRLYYEYYLNMVIHAGEDRHRLHNWTIQPLMSKKYLDYVINNLPLKRCGYYFHSELLKKIDKKLVAVNVFNSRMNLQSRTSMFKNEYKKYFGSKYSIIKRLLSREKYISKLKPNENINATNHDAINIVLKKLQQTPKDAIVCFGGEYNYLTTAILFLQSLERSKTIYNE